MIAGLNQPEEGEVIALGASAGKYNFAGSCPEQRGHLFARAFHSRPRLLSLLMDRTGIAKALKKIRLHRRKDLRQQRRGRIVVKINSPHHFTYSSSASPGTKFPWRA